MEAGPVWVFGASLGGAGGPDPGPGPLRHLGGGLLRSAGRRLRRLRPHPAGPRTWLLLGGALGLCQAAGLDPSLGVVGAVAGGLPESPLLPGGARGALALLLFAAGLWVLLGLILRLGLSLLLRGAGGALGGPGPPPRLWMALVRMFAGRRPGLHSFQGALPPLPLPPLRDTVQQAVASLQALGPGGGREQLPALAREFLGDPGPRLQRWLRLRAWALPSYLSELWEEHVHLGGRGPLPTTSNYYLMDLLGPPPTRVQAARAANAAFALLRFRGLLLRGELPPALFWGGVPSCSAQYERLFNTTRLPGERRDRLRHGGGGAHLAVLHAGRLFRVPVRRGGRGLSPRELQSQFQRVLEAGGGAGPLPHQREAPGALTAGERLPWARARAALQAGGGRNAAALRALDEAPFLVALDPSPAPAPGGRGCRDPPHPPHRDPPADGELDAEAKALLLGPCHNRWFDKALTLVAFPCGRLGLNAELAGGDPPAVGHLWECSQYALAADALELGYESSGDCRGGVAPGIPPPERLHWDLPPEVRGALGGAPGPGGAELQLHVFAVAPPPAAAEGAPPAPPPPPPPPPSDALVRLGLQLALVRERGPCLSYEPVPGGPFLEGRGEGLRGCGPPVLALAAALGDPGVGGGRRRALARAALGEQRGRRAAAMAGAGLERHLQALAAVGAQLGERPPFLAQVLGEPWALAFSPAPRAHPPLLPPSLHLAGGGFPPPHPDGYGVCYARGRGGAVVFHVSCCAASARTDARRFARRIRAALGELGELLGGEGGEE